MTTKLPKVASGSGAISHETASLIEWVAEGVISRRPSGFAMELLALEALVSGMITCERVYALTTVRIGIEHQPLFASAPNLPVEVVYPWSSPDPEYPRDDIVRALMADPLFKRLYGEESAKDTAFITAGDLWRSAMLGTAFLASETESNICLLDQLSNATKDFYRSPTDNIVGIVRSAWLSTVEDANALKGRRFFRASMPLFLASILRESQTIDDIWRVTMQMRGTKEAAAFRAWLSEVQGEEDVVRVALRMKELRNVIGDVFHITATDGLDISVGIGFPPSIDIPWSRLVKWLKPQKPHLRFLKRTVASAIAATQPESDLCRVFGVSRELAIATVRLLARASPDA